MTKLLGWKRDLPDFRDYRYTAPIIEKLPEQLTLDLKFEVYDQGRIGSCSANALAANIQFDRIKNSQIPEFIPSRLFIYYNERLIEGTIPMDNGSTIRSGIKSLRKYGVCTEECWPYIDTPPTESGLFKFGSKPTQRPYHQCYDEALNYVITDYQSIEQNLEHLQGCIVSGYPFVFGFSVYSNWGDQETASTIVPMPTGDDSMIGGHAVLCVGYDNTTQLFKFRNSWGNKVGENGYFYMPYSYILNNNLAADFWVINAIKN